jgi:hypothetical protein
LKVGVLISVEDRAGWRFSPGLAAKLTGSGGRKPNKMKLDVT